MPFHTSARPSAWVYAAYKALSGAVFTAAAPPLCLYARVSGRGGDPRQRLGCYDARLFSAMPSRRRIWIHAASVGEVHVAASVLHELARILPDWPVILSTTTVHGQTLARERLGERAVCIYAPVDAAAAVNHALTAIRPAVLAFVETEIWPNWLMAARRRGIPTALVNGRISPRSFHGYLRIRPLMRTVLSGVDAFGMIGSDDARRIVRLGAPKRRVSVCGNAKYDRLSRTPDPGVRARMERLFGLADAGPVFVAGSTRGPEPAMMMEAFARIQRHFARAVMIIAPRHPRRVPAVAEALRGRGLAVQLRTELAAPGAVRRAPVIILDTVGELSAAYSVADVVFCGGSLVPLGGQNILEAAAWSKPVFYGPSMEDFTDARALLEASGGGVQVNSAEDLARSVIACLSDAHKARTMGRAAAAAVRRMGGAARKYAEVIRGVAVEGG